MDSLETYIRTRARKLPISASYINSDWDESGIASIMVVRSHKNGNKTLGIFLVDIHCLGLKDTYYSFNQVPGEFDEMYEHFLQNAVEDCDYALVHNIIYGGIEFAADYGFEPHKDWNLT